MSLFYYGESLFNRDLRKWATKFLEKLPKDVTCLVSRGSSGCSIASAMIALSDNPLLHHYHIKKYRKDSHHETAGFIFETDVVAIVDDFIDHGDTIKAIQDCLQQNRKQEKYIIVHHNNHIGESPFKEKLICLGD